MLVKKSLFTKNCWSQKMLVTKKWSQKIEFQKIFAQKMLLMIQFGIGLSVVLGWNGGGVNSLALDKATYQILAHY